MTVNFMKRNKDNKAVVVKITPTKLNPPSPCWKCQCQANSQPNNSNSYWPHVLHLSAYQIFKSIMILHLLWNIQINERKHKINFWTFQHVRKKYLPPACFGESISRGLHPLTLTLPTPTPQPSLLLAKLTYITFGKRVSGLYWPIPNSAWPRSE